MSKKIFFPSCKMSARFSEQVKKLTEYLKNKNAIDAVAGCCRKDRLNLTQDDEAVLICQNCFAIVSESSAAKNLSFAWEIILRDENFPFKNFHGKKFYVQDCWVTRDDRHAQNVVRALLKKMNIDVVEIPLNFEKSIYCGTRLLKPCLPDNFRLAPKRFAPEHFENKTLDEQKNFLNEYVEKNFPENFPIVCSCKMCLEGFELVGRDAVHLIELLF